jgi:phage terminase Nu1 subunit (DNA packaging protein)
MSRARISYETKFQKLSQTDIAAVVGVSTRTMASWTSTGCPRNRDGSYNTVHVIRWLEMRAGARKAEPSELDRLRARKLETEADTADLILSAKKGETILLSRHDEILGHQATEMHNFLTTSFPANAEHFVGKTDVEEVRALLLELARQAVEVWINAPVGMDPKG